MAVLADSCCVPCLSVIMSSHHLTDPTGQSHPYPWVLLAQFFHDSWV